MIPLLVVLSESSSSVEDMIVSLSHCQSHSSTLVGGKLLQGLLSDVLDNWDIWICVLWGGGDLLAGGRGAPARSEG